jgi:hypothetical protein
MILHQDLFWGILALASSNSQEVHNRNFIGVEIFKLK